VQTFLRRLLLLVHITGGQPARGTELLILRWRNSARCETRNIFVENGLVSLVTSYHKNYAATNSTKIIHRYLPSEIGEMLVYYLWLVMPFVEQLHILAGLPSTDELGSFLWPAGLSLRRTATTKGAMQKGKLMREVYRNGFTFTSSVEEPWESAQLGLVKEDDPWGFAATTGKKKKKKKGVVEEEPPAPPPEPEPEPLVEPEPSPPAEEKPADGWDDWGAATRTTKKKKKKKKKGVEEEPPPRPPEPEPEPVVEPEPEPIPEPEPVEDKNDGGDWGFSSIWGGGKKKKGLKKGTRVDEEEKAGMEVVATEEEERMHESIYPRGIKSALSSSLLPL
jgi:hypothetical protein